MTKPVLSCAGPPLPSAISSDYGLMYHPLEKCLWMLAFGADQLWRYRDESWCMLARGAEIFPSAFSHRYSWGFYFYWDPGREAPVFFATGYTGAETPVLAAWKGDRFVEIVLADATKSESAECFAFDPGRECLVHFHHVVDGDTRYLQVRELDGSNRWRDIGEPYPAPVGTNSMAGYDGASGRTVYIDANGFSLAWDGNTFRAHARETTYPWVPYVPAVAPKTRAMVFVHGQRSTEDFEALIYELDANGLVPQPATTLLALGGMAHDTHRDVTYVLGPWFGPGTLQYELGTYDRGVIAPGGTVVATPAGHVARGHLFSSQKPVPRHWGMARVSCMFTLDAALSVERLPSPPGDTTLACTSQGTWAVAGDCTVSFSALGTADYATVTAGPVPFPARSGATLLADFDGDRLLLVGGAPPKGGYLKDAWLHANGAWTQLAAKGNAPGFTDSIGCFDPTRAAWIVADGLDKHGHTNESTFELHEMRWRMYPSVFVAPGGAGPSTVKAGTIAYDAVSRTTFRYGAYTAEYKQAGTFGYAGEGVWRQITDEDLGGAYDLVTRTLAAPRPGGLEIVALGPLLDTYAATAPAPVADPPAPEAESIAPEVWLRFQAGTRDHVWFARLHGSAFTTRSAQRGAPLKEKEHACVDADKAKAMYEKAVTKQLAAGYEHAVDGEQTAVIRGKPSWHFEGKVKSSDHWGGIPEGVSAKEWPMCRECKHPMSHVATFLKAAERLPLKKYEALSVFLCDNEETAGSCEVWDADAGSNAVLLRTKASLARKSLSAPPVVEERSTRVVRFEAIRYREVFEPDATTEPNADPVEGVDKLRGYPRWLQSDDTPSCTRCEQPMELVAQLNEHDGLNFTGGGLGYVFLCKAEHTAKLLIQR